jgi:hypothetical protein
MSDCSNTFKQRTSPAQRRGVLRNIIVLLIIIPATVLMKHHPSHMTRVLSAAMFSIVTLYVIVSLGLYLKEEKDEFLRDIVQRGLLWSIGATLAFIAIWAGLEMSLHVPHLPLLYIPCIFFLFTAVITTALRIYYRPRNE